MKIAIITNESTMDRCTGKGCLNAFNKRKDAFESYDDSAELVTFTHAGGDIDRKIERMIENEVDVVHLSTCLRAKFQGYEGLKERLLKNFEVIGYTHGSAVRKKKD